MRTIVLRSSRVRLLAVALIALAACEAPDQRTSEEVRVAETTSIPSFDFEAVEASEALSAEDPASAAATTEQAEPTESSLVQFWEATEGTDPTPIQETPGDFPDARFKRPEHIRGLYVNAWAAGSQRRLREIVDIARRTEVNALVIDIKDATGYISHRTEVELAHSVGATQELRIRDLPGLLDVMEEAGIYPIARIVIVKDPIMTAYRPEYAIQDTAGGVWIDSKGITWLNPYSMDVWRYHVDLAREVAKMGFPEIQWDYVRFPDAPEADLNRAVYRNRDGRERHEAIRGFLQYARSNLADLPVRSTADVFGVTTTYQADIGTGQVWEELIDVVDAALPMVYPSHYWPGSFGHQEPNARPYEIVLEALEDAERRSAAVEGAGLTRPWLQDFNLGEPAYGAPEVRAQIQATYDAGIDEWILWHPGSKYTVEALEPIGGFEQEPLVRVAGVITPVSRRHVVIDSVASAIAAEEAAAAAADSLRALELGAGAAADTVVVPRDSGASESR